MTGQQPSGRSSCLVPIIVALITALGGITVAVISNLPKSSPQPVPPVPTAAVAPVAPDIAGKYSLGVNTGRVVEITSNGGNEYLIAMPNDQYPFHGTISWTGGQHFQGTAQFDNSLVTMRVVLDRQPDNTLDTKFQFLTDDQGRAITRVDPHTLTPMK